MTITREIRVALSPQRIVDAGLVLAETYPVEAISIRKLADQLQVTPMAIYRHFPDKDALLSAMLDAFIGRASVLPSGDMHWQEWLRQLGMSMHVVLCAAPSWIPLLGRLPLQSAGLSVMEATLVKLTGSGFSTALAVRAFFALMQAMIGATSLQTTLKQHNPGSLPAGEKAFEQYPGVLDSLPEIENAIRAGLMSNSIDMLLLGLQQALADELGSTALSKQEDKLERYRGKT